MRAAVNRRPERHNKTHKENRGIKTNKNAKYHHRSKEFACVRFPAPAVSSSIIRSYVSLCENSKKQNEKMSLEGVIYCAIRHCPRREIRVRVSYDIPEDCPVTTRAHVVLCSAHKRSTVCVRPAPVICEVAHFLAEALLLRGIQLAHIELA